jgi:hypothetical protein
MQSVPFIKPDKLREYLDIEMRNCLHSNGIYDIYTYGWADADSVDPEYKSYAFWDTHPRAEYDFEASCSGRELHKNYGGQDVNLVVIGTEFLSVMHASWLALGQAFFFRDNKDNSLEFTNSSTSLISAITLLNIALDRIREFFCLDYYGKEFDKWKRLKEPPEDRRKFSTLFESVLKSHVNQGPYKLEILEKINKKVNLLKRHRDNRNNQIHQLASSYAATTQRLLLEHVKPSHGKSNNLNFDHNEHSQKLIDAKEFYVLLIDLGNLIFLFEYSRRKTNV